MPMTRAAAASFLASRGLRGGQGIGGPRSATGVGFRDARPDGPGADSLQQPAACERAGLRGHWEPGASARTTVFPPFGGGR